MHVFGYTIQERIIASFTNNHYYPKNCLVFCALQDKLIQLRRSLPCMASVTDTELGLEHPDEAVDVEPADFHISLVGEELASSLDLKEAALKKSLAPKPVNKTR